MPNSSQKNAEGIYRLARTPRRTERNPQLQPTTSETGNNPPTGLTNTSRSSFIVLVLVDIDNGIPPLFCQLGIHQLGRLDNLVDHIDERRADVLSRFTAGLDESRAVSLRQRLPLFRCNRARACLIDLTTDLSQQHQHPHQQTGKRAINTHQIHHDPRICKLRTLPKPMIHTQEALSITDVVDEDTPLRVPVVAARESSEALLSRGVEE